MEVGEAEDPKEEDVAAVDLAMGDRVAGDGAAAGTDRQKMEQRESVTSS